MAPLIPVILPSLSPESASGIRTRRGTCFIPAAMRPAEHVPGAASAARYGSSGRAAGRGGLGRALCRYWRTCLNRPGTRIATGASIGAHVKIGRDCSIGAQVSILCAYIGNEVIIHGVCDRSGRVRLCTRPGGFEKIVQIGRVIIQDKVEIGANTTIDRGAMDDTVIGEGTKIDNSVIIGHNVQIGRHCGIVAGVGIAGSNTDRQWCPDRRFCRHCRACHDRRRVPLAAMTGVATDLPAGGKYGGIPARPMKDFLSRDSVSGWQSPSSIEGRGRRLMNEDVKTSPRTAEILEIMKLLPHRYPFCSSTGSSRSTG